MKDKIEQARSETIYSDGRQRYIFLKEDLDSLLKEVAEEQREAMWDWYKGWMFPDEEMGDNEYLRSKEAFLKAPLVTNKPQP